MTSRHLARAGAIALTLILATGALAACSAETTASTRSAAAESASLWDSTVVHDIALDFDDADFDALIAAYLDTGDKEWITATVTIDGTVLDNVGLKLKGNSSLRSITADSDPATLPWIIRLDKYVDGQDYDGETELVVRGNTSATALNEAVALELLDTAGLANEEAVSSAFSINGGEAQLRLVIQNPDDEWADEEFGDGTLLYKAESGGDYSYRGDDAESYVDVFDQEVGDDDIAPLTAFLKFINESDDATFASGLSEYLDVDSFATYLAFQEVVDNFDDIDGPGNNSYLSYDTTTGLMTVVSWDLNLAFGAMNEGGGGGGGARPEAGADAPTGGGKTGGGNAPGNAAGGGAAGGGGGSNILAERFAADATFSALYDQAVTDLTASLFTSGTASQVLTDWTALLSDEASDLVSTDTITEESEALATKLEAIG